MPRIKAIDDYITQFPTATQRKLKQIRSMIWKLVPETEETIRYGMPTFNYNGKYLIYLAAYKEHLSIYPVPTDGSFQKEFSKYKTSGKGTIRFPLDQPLPVTLIEKIVKHRLKQLRGSGKPGTRSTL